MPEEEAGSCRVCPDTPLQLHPQQYLQLLLNNLVIYFTEREAERERKHEQGEVQRERLSKEPDVGLDPGTLGL